MSNVQVVPTQTGEAKKPNNLLNAISEIQQYYVFESQGDDLPPDFFTLEMFMSFMKLGFSSSLREWIIFIFIGIITYFLFPIIFNLNPITYSFLFKYASFVSMLINTLLCVFISKFYMGKLTKRIISALLSGRCIGLALISLATYIIFILIDELITKQRIFSLLQSISILFKNAPYYYYTFFKMKPFASAKIAIIILISGLIPFISIFIVSIFRNIFLKIRDSKVSTHQDE